MKILVVGDGHSILHEKVVANSMARLGHEVEYFTWHQYFDCEGRNVCSRVWIKSQNKYLFGPRLTEINLDVAKVAKKFQPEIIFIYRGTHIYGATIRNIRDFLPNAIVVGYNNDDPFAPNHIRGMWRHFLEALPELDLVLAYRHANIDDFLKAGAKRVELLRSWYVPQLNYPRGLTLEERKRFACDVVFIGHYEGDMRLDCLEEVVRRGWSLRLFGHSDGWKKVLRESPLLRSNVPVSPVWGEDYNSALCGARIALCFLSKLNRDTYTRRCFEIPASGSMLLSERTDDLEGLFVPGEEADYFSSAKELGQKLDLYLRDEQRLRAVAEAGHKKVVTSGHDVDSRMLQVIDWIEEIRAAR